MLTYRRGFSRLLGATVDVVLVVRLVVSFDLDGDKRFRFASEGVKLRLGG